jgi:hypothetical protein
MISIALVLLLILGINQIFKYTTQAVGAGEAINSAIRSSRAIQSAFAQDFAAMVPPGSGPNDAPYLIISSQQVYAYRNAKDLAGEGNYSSASAPSSTGGAQPYAPGAPFQDLAGSGTFGDSSVNGDVTYPYQYNTRNHRVDVLSFFARDQFHRQTGNPGTFVDDLSSAEALIWYGHLQIYNNSNTAYPPGWGTSTAINSNNLLASQFVLGRMAMLLVQPQLLSDNSIGIQDTAGNKQNYLNATGGGNVLDPLCYSSAAQDNAQLYQSRYDLAGTSIAAYRSRLQANVNALTNPNGWWQTLNGPYLMDGEVYSGTGASYRFACNPYVSKPMNAAAMAETSPYFLGSCSQFNPNGETLTINSQTVTYNYGDTKGVGPDGEVDYRMIRDPVTQILRKQIIWYGLPRNTSGQPGCSLLNGDVAPVYYLLTASSSQGGAGVNPANYPYAFEKTAPSMGSNTDLTTMKNGSAYICAWGPNDKATRPKMIRITLTLDDPNGQLADGQTYQYVFAVP